MTPGPSTLPAVGAPAPDFTLPSTSGEDVTLSDFRGRSHVLLAFFPLAFTGVCTTELCDFTGEQSAFTDAGAVVFGVSVDSVPTLKAFQEHRGIGVDLLSDFHRTVCRQYGTLLEPEFFSSRSYVIVDREGTVRWTFTEESLGDKRTNAELLTRLGALDG